MKKYNIIQYDKREPEHAKLWLEKVDGSYRLKMWNNGWEIIATASKIDIDLAALEERVSTNETSISNINTNIVSINASITEIDSSLDSLESRVSTNETNISTLQSSVSTLETRADTEFITNASYDEENKQIVFTVANGDTVCTVDCTDFLIDGMLSTAELVVNPDGQDEGTYIHLVFNTDAGKDDIYINVTTLIDIYTGSDSITVSDDNEISVNDDYVTDLINSNVRYETIVYTERFGTGIGVLYVCDTEYIISIYAANKSQAGIVQIGDGIAVTTDGIISIQISDSSEAYLTVDENGLAITGIDAIEARVTQAETDIDNLETRMDTAEADIDALEVRMTTAETDIDNIEGRMTTAEEDIDKLEERMDAAEETITTLNETVSTLDARVTTAETDIDNLEARMGIAETAINNNANNIATNAANISSLFTILTGLQGTLTTIQSTLYSTFGVNLSYDEDTHIVTLSASDGTVLSTIDLSDLVSNTVETVVTNVTVEAGYGITVTATTNDDGDIVYTVTADVGTDNDTITTVSSGDDYIAVADDGSYNYTITANLERITEDEITTLWEAI